MSDFDDFFLFFSYSKAASIQNNKDVIKQFKEKNGLNPYLTEQNPGPLRYKLRCKGWDYDFPKWGIRECSFIIGVGGESKVGQSAKNLR